MSRLAALALLVALAATRVAAAPCITCDPVAATGVGWWNDRPLVVGATEDHAPRIDVDGDGVTNRAAIVFERRDAATGSGDIWLAATDDGGCSWMPRAVTSGPENDSLPDVAISLALDTIAIVFVQDGLVVATISLDGGGSFSSPEPIAPLAATDSSSHPRLGAITVGSTLHLHVAWTEGGRIHHARSLSTGALGSWSSGPPLSDRFSGFSSWTHADIAADSRSFDPATLSAVTLVGSGAAALDTTPQIFAVRSNDSGTTFFGNPEDPLTLNVPARVSDARPANQPAVAALEPVLDVSDNGSGEFYTWEAVSYTDRNSSAGTCPADARAEEGGAPSTVARWNDALPGDVNLGEGVRSAGIAVIPNPLQRPPSPEAHFFFDSGASGSNEVHALRANLDVNVPRWVDITCPPRQLTGVVPSRASGDVVARSVSADEDLSHVFIAWADTRDGGSSIWWKRNDTLAEPATGVGAGPAPCASGGGLLVSWTLPASPPNCDVDHVRVEHGRSPGITDASIDVASGTSVVISGLLEGVTYFARVIVVDEACNEAPAPEVSGMSAACSPVACPLPVGPSLLAARRPSDGDVELTWAAPAVDGSHDAATSYDVYRATIRPQDGFSLLANVPSPLQQDLGGALPGTALRHFYLIVARNSCGTSGDEPLP